jgi:hypothetical protein
MTTPTSNLGLLKGVGSDNWRAYLKTSLAASLDVLDKAIGQVTNVKGYGAVGNGATDDRAAILSAEAAMGVGGGTLFFPPGTYRIATSLTLLPTTNLFFPGGAVLAPAAGTTVRIAGTVAAGLYQIVAIGGGAVVFDRVQTLYPEWWGATTYVKTRSTGGAITSGSTAFTTGGDPANAGTTVTQSRWAVGTDQTANVQACLDASSGGNKLCPVVLSDLYGINSIGLRNSQVMTGVASLELCGFMRLGVDANPAVHLAAGVSGDTINLRNFVVNAMYAGTLDGIEIGTAASNLAIANGIMENILVRNAAGIAFNLRVNGLVYRHLISKQDQAPPAANTTAKAARFIDTLVYGVVLGATGYYPAGVYELGSGGGSVYIGIEAETAGVFAGADQVTINASGVRIMGLYLHHAGTCRDLVRIPTGFNNTRIDQFLARAGATCTNILNDVDRAYVFAGASPIGDVEMPLYHNATRWAQATVSTLETTTSTSYVNLTTTGPAVSISPVLPTDQMVEVSADVSNSAAGVCLMAPSLSGTAAVDTDSCTVQGTSQSTTSRRVGAANQATAATHTAKYRVTSGTGSWSNRRISVEVIRP